MIGRKVFYKLTLTYNNYVQVVRNDLNDGPYYSINAIIDKSAGITVHNANIILYNIPEEIRERFAKSARDTFKIINISLEAGDSQRSMALVFSGIVNIFENKKVEGHTVESQINCYAGALDVNSIMSSFSLGENATIYDVKKQYANTLGVDFISDSTKDFLAIGENYSSATNAVVSEIIANFKTDDVFIDNKKIHFFDSSYYNKKKLSILPVLSEKTGVISLSPNLREIECFLKLFLTKASVIKIEMETNTYKTINGIHKIVGIVHSFTSVYNGKTMAGSKIEIFPI